MALSEEDFLIANTYSLLLSIDEIKKITASLFPLNQVEVSKLCIKSVTGKIIEYGELTRIF